MAQEIVSPAEAWVLVVEDDERNAEVIVAMLMAAGVAQARIAVAADGAQALAAAAQLERVDMVLLDLQLPDESGYQVLERLRPLPRFAPARIIAVTANVMPQEVAQAEAAGFDGFLGKPL